MHLRVLALTAATGLALAACGGKSGPATARNTGGTPGPAAAPALWAEVLVPGARFQLDNGALAATGTTTVLVTAEVTAVTTDGEAQIATLTWTAGDGPMTGGLPTAIKVSPAGVWFSTGPDDTGALFTATPTFPTGATDIPGDGFSHYVTTADTTGATCYGEGPAADAGDCADVCFAELCVAPGRGIVSGGGTWWPDYGLFEASAE